MLTRQTIREQLDAIADDILQDPCMYHELFSRLFCARVNQWVREAAPADASLIEEMAAQDHDYHADLDLPPLTQAALPAIPRVVLFNPDWDVSY